MECQCFQLPRCKSLHTALRRRRFGVRILAGAPVFNVDHDVRAASRLVTAAVRVRVPLVNPITNPKLRQRSSRLLPGRAGRTSLRVHHGHVAAVSNRLAHQSAGLAVGNRRHDRVRKQTPHSQPASDLTGRFHSNPEFPRRRTARGLRKTQDNKTQDARE